MSTTQIVSEAVSRSVSHTEIVTIEVGPSGLVCSGGGVSGERACKALAEICDDSVENGRVTEYWGTDDEGREWRVHVRTVEL
jgi:hypothetical protein